MAIPFLMPFTPHGEFKVRRPMTIDGVALKFGDRVPKEKLSERRLGQMYVQRLIEAQPFGDLPPPAYLNNGVGKAEQLARELAAEEGKASAQSRPAPKPAKAKRPDTKRTAPASKPAKPAKVGAKSAPARKSGRAA